MLNASGSDLTGSFEGGRGGAVDISDGTIDGNKVSFKVVREFNGNQFTQQYKGTLSDSGELNLTVSMGGGAPCGGRRFRRWQRRPRRTWRPEEPGLQENSELTRSQPRVARVRHDKSVRLAFLLPVVLFASVAYSQQAQQPAPRSAGGPPADQKAIFQRALEMYKAKSYANALRAFREAAEAGNVEAMMYVGTMQASGQGTEASPSQAMVWFTKAANAGDGQAMCNLGILYYRGSGCPEKIRPGPALVPPGFDWPETAQAMFNAGVLYRDGLGVPVDFSAAMDLVP